MRKNFYARYRLNYDTNFHSTDFYSATFHSNIFHSTTFAVLSYTVLVYNSYLDNVYFPLYARDSIDLICKYKNKSMLSVDLWETTLEKRNRPQTRDRPQLKK